MRMRVITGERTSMWFPTLALFLTLSSVIANGKFRLAFCQICVNFQSSRSVHIAMYCRRHTNTILRTGLNTRMRVYTDSVCHLIFTV